MILLVLCIMFVFAIVFLQFLLLEDYLEHSEFESIATVISMNVILYFSVSYIIEKAYLIGWF